VRIGTSGDKAGNQLFHCLINTLLLLSTSLHRTTHHTEINCHKVFENFSIIEAVVEKRSNLGKYMESEEINVCHYLRECFYIVACTTVAMQ
jgi:hypothetical protein